MPETIYRLSIAPALEAFRPEIEHACGFLDGCYHVRRTSDAPRTLHYGPGAATGAVAVPAALFPRGARLDADGIHPEPDVLAQVASFTVGGLRPAAALPRGGDPIGYDALGLIFLFISRLEERDHPARDRYQRFPIDAALFQPEDGRLYPFADRAAHDLAAALVQGEPQPRTRYAVHFSHDVDILRGYHRPLAPLREAAGDALKRGRPGAALRRLRNAYLTNEPWGSFRRLMKASERRGLKGRFYFMGPTGDPMDSPYVLSMQPLLRKLAAEIAERGHEIGFHPGFRTAIDAGEWRRQRDGLEAALGRPVREGRQHVLRYDAAVTPRIWSDSGMTLDHTLAYPEAVGFRSGTCRPHHAYDLAARRTLPLMQLSTAVMEFGLFGGKYRDLPLQQAVADAKWAADRCREFGGTFALLFHTGQSDAHLWRWLDAVLDEAVR